MTSGVTVLVGTTKGAFLLNGGSDRGGWKVKGPFCDGWPINHVIGDPESGTIWAGGGGEWSGAGVWRSVDGGETWEVARLTKGTLDDWAANDPETAKFLNWTPQDLPFADDFSQIWSLGYAHGTLYAGTKPARFLASRDGGKSFAHLEGLANHPSADSWNPGAAGLVLHTIVSDPDNPKKLWIGISAAGVFASEDGGMTWERRNRLSNAAACEGHDHPASPRDGETGHCVHNMMRAPGDNDLLYQQNHHGVWRSADGGLNWDNITDGLPSTFGFPIRVHPRDPDTIWTLPLNGDTEGRFPPVRQQPCGSPMTVAEPGGTSARAFRRKPASSRFCVRRWAATHETPPGSTSAQTQARFSPAWMKVKPGRKLPAICRQCWPSRFWTEDKTS